MSIMTVNFLCFSMLGVIKIGYWLVPTKERG